MVDQYSKQLRLLKGIVATSIITVALLSCYSFFFLSPAYTSLIERITEREANRVANLITHSSFKEKTTLSEASIPTWFPPYINDVIDHFGLMKVKIFTPSGEIIYSNDPADVGTINTHPYFHEIVKKGQPYTKIVQKNTKSLEEKLISIDVVETYVPIMDKERFLGAFELYYDITTIVQELTGLIAIANTILMSIGGGLFLAMVFIVTKTKKNISARKIAEQRVVEQSHLLSRQNEELSMINAIADVISKATNMDTLLPNVLNIIANHQCLNLNCSKAGILLCEEEQLVLAAHVGLDQELIKQHENITIYDSRYSTALQTDKIVFSDKLTSSKETPPLRNYQDSEDHRDIVIPLRAHGQTIGILYLHIPLNLNIEYKEEVLAAIGSQIGLAISNMKMFMRTQQEALYDQLTGLANRHNMKKHLPRFISEAERHHTPLSVALLDIDFFKKFNDTYGHVEGDSLLTKIAKIIVKTTRDIDFPARYGGEELLVIFPTTTIEEAQVVCERVRVAIEKETKVTISAGISQFRPKMTGTELIDEADQALYKAKSNNRNRVELAQTP